jgi:hypothetical protein
MEMINENQERWKVPSEQAAVEQDPVKLHVLIKGINRLLHEKEARLQGNHVKNNTPQNSSSRFENSLTCANRRLISQRSMRPPPKGLKFTKKKERQR